jgi:hypothetical protein
MTLAGLGVLGSWHIDNPNGVLPGCWPLELFLLSRFAEVVPIPVRRRDDFGAKPVIETSRFQKSSPTTVNRERLGARSTPAVRYVC